MDIYMEKEEYMKAQKSLRELEGVIHRAIVHLELAKEEYEEVHMNTSAEEIEKIVQGLLDKRKELQKSLDAL